LGLLLAVLRDRDTLSLVQRFSSNDPKPPKRLRGWTAKLVPQNIPGLEQPADAVFRQAASDLGRCDRRVRTLYLRQRLPFVPGRTHGREDGASRRRRHAGGMDDLGALLPDRPPGRIRLLALARH